MTQNLQSRSSSLPHAGQRTTVRSWPQCGQKLISRPGGRAPLQYGQFSPSSRIITDFMRRRLESAGGMTRFGSDGVVGAGGTLLRIAAAAARETVTLGAGVLEPSRRRNASTARETRVVAKSRMRCVSGTDDAP